MNIVKRFFQRIPRSFFLIGLISLVWFLIRTGSKPSRAVYPCQRIAASNGSLWLSTYILVPLSVFHSKLPKIKKTELGIILVGFTVLSSIASLSYYWTWDVNASMSMNEELLDTSKIFVVNGTNGNDEGVARLIALMGEHELLFYKSDRNGSTYGATGLISSNSVIIIKVNSQWDQRGGTNTDLLRNLIQAILNHPDGFNGEIIVADNGQGRGSLDRSQSNAENHSQSAQKVVDLFSETSKVSTFLWDMISENYVNEYSFEDLNNGYVVNETADSETGLKVSYPKFKSEFGTYVSFKNGIWNLDTNSYDTDKLIIINMPVLKTHGNYDVTACVKHYMGVVSQNLTSAHSSVGKGGMGTEMVETRFPTLNILDAIWVRTIPGSGPFSYYQDATEVNCILASIDPVALDYWASKNILIPAARKNGYTDISSIDPDNTSPGSFGTWLRLSMQEIIKGNFQATVNESNINVVSTFTDLALSDFDSQFATNNVSVIQPSDSTSKPLVCGASMESDWAAASFVITKLEHYMEGLDINSSFVNQVSGVSKGPSSSGIVSFGGPLVNPVVKYAESINTPSGYRAPLRFFSDGTTFYFQQENGATIVGANLPISVINSDQDMFLIEVYMEASGRYVMFCYGFGWKGTYAAGEYFHTTIYPNLASHNISWIIVKWQDTNSDGFVNNPGEGDTFTVIASS